MEELTVLHLNWIQQNNLPEHLYIDFLQDTSSIATPFLERSIKLDLQTGNVVNQKRYSINIKTSTEEIIQKTLKRFSVYSCIELYKIKQEIKSWLNLSFDHDWYVGIDNEIPKIGADFYGKYIAGIAAKNGKLYSRRYDPYNTEEWFNTLTEYVEVYAAKFNKQIKKALDETIKNTVQLEDSYIYIKQEESNIVWHFNCKTFNYPQFDCLLNSNFKEHFTWFSLDSNLQFLTLYIRPSF